MFVETVTYTRKGKSYRYNYIRETFREDGKIKHRKVADLTGLSEDMILRIKAAIAGKELISVSQLRTTDGREYGASSAFLSLARAIGLDTDIHERKEQWREDVLAMIVGKFIYQGSKLHLASLHDVSCLWDLCGHLGASEIDVEECCYKAMDKLLAAQARIQRKLAERHLSDGCLVLYHLTNCWLEGEFEDVEIARYGRSKEGRRRYKQVAIGLITNARGCPVAIEVFGGNTSDQSTVLEQAKRLATRYNLKDVVMVGDRGILTPKRIAEVNEIGFRTLTALTHPQVEALLERTVAQPGLFDERNITELIDPDNPEVRYALCKNEETRAKESHTRDNLIDKTKQALEGIAKTKRKRDPQKVSSRVGKVLAKWHVGKFFTWEVSPDGALSWTLDEDDVLNEQAIDGCYVVRTDASKQRLSAQEAVDGYKGLAVVEMAFRNLKTVMIEIRPIHHHLPDRIRAHVFLCMLSYYLQWHATQLLSPLFSSDGKGRNRKWTVANIILKLKTQQAHKYILPDGTKIPAPPSEPNEDQKGILNLLNIGH